MKIVITGADGQVGRALQETLAGATLTLLDRPHSDITDRAQIAEQIGRAEPGIVIHAAAMTDVDGCAREPELAYRVNGVGAQNVALACRQCQAVMVHISTNEVFAGDRFTGYDEWMPPAPVNAYGRSKAAAEHMVSSILHRLYIVRTAWVYARGGRNFIHAIRDRARERGEVRVVVDEVGNPTYALDLARAIEQLLATDQYGTYHLVNAEPCSRWEFAAEILRLSGQKDVANTPILSSAFKRASAPPPYAALNNNAGAALGITLRSWREALADYLARPEAAA